MNLGYVILYCLNVAATSAHYQAAFGLHELYVHESGMYIEMDTGGTTLAFASSDLAEMNDLAIRLSDPKQTPGSFEIVLVTEDVEAAYVRAVEHGAMPVKPAKVMPWGQTVAYVRDINGYLVELASPLPPRAAP